MLICKDVGYGKNRKNTIIEFKKVSKYLHYLKHYLNINNNIKSDFKSYSIIVQRGM